MKRIAAALVLFTSFAFAAEPAPITWENPLKKLLREGKPVVGMTVTVASADVVLQAARVGFVSSGSRWSIVPSRSNQHAT